ncbi:hypothetical protein O9K51_05195 [Purpureocillium lavendulum]|uniref:Secreted protein n=1 Tax=Purpureocillium lavendulum TaxID=1247861 RepID=A0AB34FR95_9HYPO|nr:hypothetical protein O9K51_05195 [Purpureocillium lavendulum]
MTRDPAGGAMVVVVMIMVMVMVERDDIDMAAARRPLPQRSTKLEELLPSNTGAIRQCIIIGGLTEHHVKAGAAAQCSALC